MKRNLKFFPKSILVDGCLPFERAVYHASINPFIGQNFVGFVHELSNAPFLQKQIRSGRASFGSILYTQNTLYKQLYLSNTPLQVVPWNTDDVGQKPEFQALIVATEEFKYEFSKKDEVSKPLLGKTVTIPKGTRLAHSIPGKSNQDIFDPLRYKLNDSFLKYRVDNDLQDGGFYVSVESGRDGRIVVFMAADLYNFMETEPVNGQGSHQLHRSVLAHVLTSVFWVVRDRIRNDDNNDFVKKHQGIADLLTELAGISFMSQVGRPDFQPDKVATGIAPLVFGQAKEKRSSRFLEFEAGKFELLRSSLIEEKGSDAQVALLKACLGRKSFFSWVKLNLNGGEVGQVVPDVFSRKLDEDEFKGMKELVEQEATQLWCDVPLSVACRSSFWGMVTVSHIEKGIIEPSYLASYRKSISGVERIELALVSKDNKEIDHVARTILRKLSGLPEARGVPRSVSCDCPFGRAWWRQRILRETLSLTDGNRQEISDTLYKSKSYWEKLFMLPQMEIPKSTPARFGDSKVRTAFIWALSDYITNYDYRKLFASQGLIDDCLHRFARMSLEREFGVFELEELKCIIKEEVIEPEHTGS